jgi:YnbE-like lipoprotein
LTLVSNPATTWPITVGGHFGMAGTSERLRRLCLAAVVVAGSMLTAGCITVKAPDKPIVIELNINIKQEVVYRLAGDASQTIDNNKDIF